MPATETQIQCLKAWPRTCWVFKKVLSYNKKESHLLNLPPILFLIIMSELSDASAASLALTCKALLSFFSDYSIFRKVQLPSEQPRTFRDPEMSKPQVYQPARWEFLHFLERDLKGTWYLCSECFTLHPPRMYTSWMVPSFENRYYVRKPENRTCREGRQTLCSRPYYALAPTGIVDLCPCIKLTVGKKHQIEARLREHAWKIHANGRPAADFWWHECRQVYGNVQVELRIGLFLYDGTEVVDPASLGAHGTWILNWAPRIGHLGALLEYRLTFPSQSETESPRLLCPHRYLVKSIELMLKCRETHKKLGTFCESCRNCQFCQQCRTKVHDLRKLENINTYKNYGWILGAGGRFEESSTSTIGSLGLLSGSRRNMIGTKLVSYSFRVEKCLDGNLWPVHTVFPYARRQVPLDRSSPAPYKQRPHPDGDC